MNNWSVQWRLDFVKYFPSREQNQWSFGFGLSFMKWNGWNFAGFEVSHPPMQKKLRKKHFRPSVCLSVCHSVSLSVCLSVLESGQIRSWPNFQGLPISLQVRRLAGGPSLGPRSQAQIPKRAFSAKCLLPRFCGGGVGGVYGSTKEKLLGVEF